MSRGIRTVTDIRDRCRIEEGSGCWLWSLSLTRDGQPKCCAVLPDGRHYQSTAGRICWMLSREQNVPRRKVIYRQDGCPKSCCNPEHLRVSTKAQAGAAITRSGRLRGDPRRSLINLRNRCQSSVKLDHEKAATIRASDEPTAVLAAEYGVTTHTIREVRHGNRWVPQTGALRGASEDGGVTRAQ